MGVDLATFVPTHEKNQGVMTIVYEELQSQGYLTIYYIYNNTLEGSSCCEMLESVQTHSILVLKVGVDLDSRHICPHS